MNKTFKAIDRRKSKYGEGTLYWVEVKVTGNKKNFSCNSFLTLTFDGIRWFGMLSSPYPISGFTSCLPRRTRRSMFEEYMEQDKAEDDDLPESVELSDVDFPDEKKRKRADDGEETGTLSTIDSIVCCFYSNPLSLCRYP